MQKCMTPPVLLTSLPRQEAKEVGEAGGSVGGWRNGSRLHFKHTPHSLKIAPLRRFLSKQVSRYTPSRENASEAKLEPRSKVDIGFSVKLMRKNG